MLFYSAYRMHWGTSYPVSAQCRSCRHISLYQQICWLKTLLLSPLLSHPPLSDAGSAECLFPSVVVLPLTPFLTVYVFIEHAFVYCQYFSCDYGKQHVSLFTFLPQKFNIQQCLAVRVFPKFSVRMSLPTASTSQRPKDLISLSLPFVAAWPLGSFQVIFCHACPFLSAML